MEADGTLQIIMVEKVPIVLLVRWSRMGEEEEGALVLPHLLNTLTEGLVEALVVRAVFLALPHRLLKTGILGTETMGAMQSRVVLLIVEEAEEERVVLVLRILPNLTVG